MKQLLEALVVVAAAWRITRLVTQDEIARELREYVEDRWPGSKVAYLVTCPYCVSVWAGLAIEFGLVPRPVVVALAASAGALVPAWVDEAVTAFASKER